MVPRRHCFAGEEPLASSLDFQDSDFKSSFLQHPPAFTLHVAQSLRGLGTEKISLIKMSLKVRIPVVSNPRPQRAQDFQLPDVSASQGGRFRVCGAGLLFFRP